ncbi:putative inorganic phosphate cotransporter isoform X3 [Phymastichus coffea]|uniref:putative inorganic phosphate cotransporter isoform X3 n=1 Tax=Phymastichus coffea TaxID=108790 RepID=UPI00273B916B|nr:putative inorganic phosphate cotransporter isoform X3 [Phymastichus coffea]
MLDNGKSNGESKPPLGAEVPGCFEDAELRPPNRLIGTRHVVTFMLFLGMANAYVMRTNMSVAIVAMVNHTAIIKAEDGHNETQVSECGEAFDSLNGTAEDGDGGRSSDGQFAWDARLQGYLLSSFFYGYVITQIPFGILAKRYGSKYFLGVGMLINSVFGLLVPLSAEWGYYWLMAVRFIQGLGEGPIVPCTHAMLAKWIPPNERSRMGAFVYAGAQFGTVISMPLSGLLSEHGFADGWPSIFYVFGTVGTIWCIAFLMMVHEDPESHPRINEDEKKYILSALWSGTGTKSPTVPWKAISTSLPFWAILIAHMGQNYGYETLMTELPTFMKQILHFHIKSNGLVSALPYLAMWLFSMVISHVADWIISSGRLNHTHTRKLINSIGQFGPALALVAASYTGCNPWLTVSLLTIGVGLNGGIYSGFKVNHLDISPRFAGVLMSFTNCLANLAGLLAPITAGYVIVGTQPTHTKWRIVFILAAAVYVLCAMFYIIFGTGERQSWDNPDNDEVEEDDKDSELRTVKTISETRH